MVFTSDTYIALASAFTAICALVVTIWQGLQNAKHNRMSVRPKLTAMEDFENDDHTRLVTFRLVNAGFGPAIIKDFILVYDGKEISRNNHRAYEDFLRKKTRAFTDIAIFSFSPGSSLVVNEPSEIFSFRHKREQDASFMDKFNLRINYQCIYEDETFVYDTQKDQKIHGRE